MGGYSTYTGDSNGQGCRQRGAAAWYNNYYTYCYGRKKPSSGESCKNPPSEEQSLESSSTLSDSNGVAEEEPSTQRYNATKLESS